MKWGLIHNIKEKRFRLRFKFVYSHGREAGGLDLNSQFEESTGTTEIKNLSFFSNLAQKLMPSKEKISKPNIYPSVTYGLC